MELDGTVSDKSEQELIAELDLLRQRVAELEEREAFHSVRYARYQIELEDSLSYERAWLDLARTDTSDLDLYIQTLLRRTSETLQVERVSYWLLAQDQSFIECSTLYSRSHDRFFHERHVLTAEQFPVYMNAITEHRSVVASRADEHPHTQEFAEPYLKPLGITSMLDVPVWLEGRMAGIVCHEHVGPARVWTSDEKQFAESMGDLLGHAIEASERKKAQEKLDLAARIIENSNEAVVITDHLTNIIYVNEAFCNQSGYTKEELVGNTPAMLKSGRHHTDFYRNMRTELLEKGQWQGEIWDRRKSGEVYPKLLSISAIKNDLNEITQFVGFSSDISRIKHTEAELQRLAHYDPLTGLANRLLLRDRLNMAIAEGRRHGGSTALVLLDLDGFKNVNDSFGHLAGDQLLISVAERLQACVREIDTAGRLGGDEFAVVLSGMIDTSYVRRVCGRIVESLSLPFDLEGREIFISTGLGVAVCPADGSDVDTLLQNADIALYNAKDQGKNVTSFFSRAMNVEVMEKSELEIDLRAALKSNELSLHFQPIIDSGSGRMIGVEALLRWFHAKRGAIPPEKIQQVAEERGMIVLLGEWVLRRACEQNLAWQELGLRPIRVSVNVSGHQIARAEYADTVLKIIDETGMDCSLLELEITESVALKDLDATTKALNKLRSRGIQIFLDDFGTGYSSLSYMKLIPLDGVKIDKSFVRDIGSYDGNQPIVVGIVSVSRGLKLRVVAEGLETAAQLGFLSSLGCDEWQGHLFSGAVPANEIERILREDTRALSFNFHWTPDLEVGNELMDAQHKVWFSRVNELCKAIIGRTTDSERRDLAQLLADYSRLHFGDEESLMIESRYDGYRQQRKAHRELIDEIEALVAQVTANTSDSGRLVDIVRHLNDWFRIHITGMDRSLADHLRLKSSGSVSKVDKIRSG